jgi:predicted transglutaminase-like cysteine proteinase
MLNEEGRLILTPDLWKLVQQAHREGNAHIEWRSDKEVWGEIDRWDFPKELGKKAIDDCDGFTLWKMRWLIQHGVPPQCLWFTACITGWGEGHAILCVATDRGDFFLDNTKDEVVGYNDLVRDDYKFLFRTKDGKMDGGWVKIVS